MHDVPQGAVGECLRLGADFAGVERGVLEDRELVGGGECCVACVHQRCHNVVEHTSQVVYDIAEDRAEPWFFDLLRHKGDRAPAGLWIDCGKPNRVRSLLLDARHRLSLERVRVLTGTCELGVTGAEV
jgi:hypothetical protein